MHQQTSRFPHKPLRPIVNTVGRIGLLSGLAAVLAGCSGGDSIEYAEVVGSIRMGNHPVTSGLIEFVPRADLGTHGPKFLAAIDAEGHFSVGSALESKGAIPGHYRVTVSALPELGTGSSSVVRYGVPLRQETSKAAESAEIPSQFSREETSTIDVEVHSGTNELDLDLLSFSMPSDRRQAAR